VVTLSDLLISALASVIDVLPSLTLAALSGLKSVALLKNEWVVDKVLTFNFKGFTDHAEII